MGFLAVSGMPSHLPPPKHDQSKAPSLQRVVLHAFSGTMDLSDSLPAPRDFSHPALYARSLPDKAAGEGLSCSALLCPDVPPPATPERSSIPSVPRCCLLPSPRNDRLGPPKHLSADYLTRLLRSRLLRPADLLPSLSRAFDTPLGSVGSLLPAGVCYRALRRLPGQDLHLLEQRVFQDAPSRQ